MNGRAFFSSLAMACALSACGTAERGDSGEIESAGDMSAFTLQVGDCYDDAVMASEEVSAVPAIPCSEPHDNEVFALFDMEGDVFPGDEAALALADERCLEYFAEYVGTTYQKSVLAITHLVPSAGSWDQIGDREIVCVAYHMELKKLTGSVRGTAM